MNQGYWESIKDEMTGCLPDSREGASTNLLDNKLYLFGGFARELYSDIRVLDKQTNAWRMIDCKGTKPEPRFAHTMCQYDDKLVLFGGAGPYMSSVKMRLSFNDMYHFNTRTERWQ